MNVREMIEQLQALGDDHQDKQVILAYSHPETAEEFEVDDIEVSVDEDTDQVVLQ